MAEPKSEIQTRYEAEFEARGEAAVREMVRLGHIAGPKKLSIAANWLAGKDEARAFSAQIDAARSNSASTALQRRAATATERAAVAAETAAKAALDSASEAKTSNEIARAANELASSANALASRANNRSRDANKIAIGAMIVAAITATASIVAALLRAH
jgi:hypothetical protein